MSPMPRQSVVLVDDEKPYADLMSLMIETNLGCRVATFTRPLDALSALSHLNPSVIVTDYFMPDLNGLEFIRRAVPLVPVAAFVLITGHNLCATEHEMEKLSSLKGFLEKPFGWRTLANEIVRVWPDGVSPPRWK